MSVQAIANPRNLSAIKDVLTWTVPALAIPALRFQQDSRENRKELFLRDATTYSFGAVLFLGTALGARRLLGKLSVFSPAVRDFTSFMVALTANILYAGIGAVRLSKAYTRREQQRTVAASPLTVGPALEQPVTFQAIKEFQTHAKDGHCKP